MIPRKKNIAGYYDEQGRFRPIRKPSFVGSQRRKATGKDRKKYSRAKAGDLGKRKQFFAREDIFDREARKIREHDAKMDRLREREMRKLEREMLGDQDSADAGRTLVEFVRSSGGIRPTFKYGGKKFRGHRESYDFGELEPFTYKQSGKRGLVSEKGKKTLDGMFQSARESGYDVADPWDLLNAMDDELKSGKALYANHGFLSYNPAGKSDLYVSQLGPRSFGVFLKTYLLKKFPTKAGAETYMRSIRSKAKVNPAGPLVVNKLDLENTRSEWARMAKENGWYKSPFYITVWLDASGNIVNSLSTKGMKRDQFKSYETDRTVKVTLKNPSAVRAAKAAISIFDNDLDLDVDEKDLRRLQAATRKLASRRKNGGRSIKRNPVGWFREVSPVTPDAVKKLYRTLAAKYHPDKGGDTRTMQEINADYAKAMKIAISGEGNSARAKAETAAVEPLREAIEFAVTLPDDVKVVIRGLWLWIEGNTFKAKDQIKSFKSSDGNRFKWASKKKAWFFAAVPSLNRRGEMSFDEIDALHGRQDVTERKRRFALNPADPLTTFAMAAGGIASALQIKQMLNSDNGGEKPKRRGTKTAQLARVAKNPVGVTSGSKYNDKLFYQDLSAIEDGDYKKVRSATAHGRLAGYSKAEVDWLIQRAKLASRLKAKLNPADLKKEMRKALKNPAAYPFQVVGGTGRVVASFKTLKEAREYSKLHPAYSVKKVNPKPAATAKTPARASKKNPIRIKLHKFYKGQTVSTRSIGDHDIVYTAKIISRTPSMVTFDAGDGVKKAKIHRSGDHEYFFPFGRYSMAPTFRSTDKLIRNPKARAGKAAGVRSKANPERCLKCRKMTAEGVFDLNGGLCERCNTIKQATAKSKGVDRDTIVWENTNSRGLKSYGFNFHAAGHGFKVGKTYAGHSGNSRERGYKSKVVSILRGGKKAIAGSRKANPTKPPRSRLFETFQGRKVTSAVRRPVSAHAPSKLVQLGDLVELHVKGVGVLKTNPKTFKLAAANGKLWIVGGKIAKANPTAKANEINPIGKLTHVVYGTRKPHHGDHNYTHYIHKLGEESGNVPLLCADRDGYAVLRGGNYKIEARGIVD